MTEPYQFAYPAAGATLYVTILAAKHRSDGGWHKPADEQVFLPRIRVSTAKSSRLDAEHGPVTIRGRKYTIDSYITWEERPGWTDREGKPVVWHTESSYRGDYRSDQDRKVEYDTPTFRALRAIVEGDVLAQFEAEHPGWRRISERLALEAERATWLRSAETALAEVAAAERKAAAITKRLLPYVVQEEPAKLGARLTPIDVFNHRAELIGKPAALAYWEDNLPPHLFGFAFKPLADVVPSPHGNAFTLVFGDGTTADLTSYDRVAVLN
ncbi:hypothetical protein AB0D08_00575 [Kitasatospora sp. NPDC048540]|uniref:hypothetical protein n=1 Tax=Kitasatospora sp. NPDC048540 TaxID=3155634 RepID=UPI0033FE98C7